jgi:HlyD family secretion protein
MNSKQRGVGVVVVMAAAIALGYWWMRPAPLAVTLIQPSRGDLISSVVNTRAGTIKSCQRAGLSLPMGGVVENILVQAGDRVTRGQPLLTLWHADLQAELQRAQATAALNRVLREQSCVQAEFNQRQATRLLTLRAKDLTSKTLSEQAESLAATSHLACLAADKQAKVDDAQIAAAQARLEESQLRAPFAGVIAEVNSKLGEYMTPSPPGVTMPPVIDLIDDQCLYISAPIDEIDAARLRVGQSAVILLDALPGKRYPAKLRRIAPYVKEVEKQARTVEIEAEFTPRPQDVPLLIGYSADVEVEVARRDQVLRIPAEARREDGTVLRLKAGHLEAVLPVFGLENWNWLEVKSGLTAEDQLVRQASQLKFDPKQAVRAKTAEELQAEQEAKP